MEMNHHILAKIATESILKKFKSEEWNCCGAGKDLFRVTNSATFPSPDATFYNEKKKFLVSFEFKPPTETKRGILTGVGQSIAYLRESNISFLVAPLTLNGYDLENYLSKLYREEIYNKIPTGLILYNNDNPEIVSMNSNIGSNVKTKKKINIRNISTERYWAKYTDLPIPLFHLILHSYFLGSNTFPKTDGFKYCWKNFIANNVVEELKPHFIYDCKGDIILTPQKTKSTLFFEKQLNKIKNKSIEEQKDIIRKYIDTERKRDSPFSSWKKNYVTFMKHLQLIDSSGELTESGIKLYQIGILNGPNSKIFRDYYAKEILTTGHHLELLLDLDTFIRNNLGLKFSKIKELMELNYQERGLLKRNPNRQVGDKSKTPFLKNECILWTSLDLINPTNDGNYNVNWKNITSVCSLPDI